MKNIIKIKLVNDCNNKLQFVKNIKELCGLDLRNSKDIADRVCQKPYLPVELDIPTGISTKEAHDKIRYNLSFSGDYIIDFEINGGTQWQREIKMLQLGVGERKDYLDFLKQHIQTNFGNSDEMLTFVLDKLTQEQLQETIDKIKY
jgi:hypothetical protein